jgi:hypothetical protein
MDEWTIFFLRAVFIGVGATVVMDIYAIILKQFFSIKSLDYGILERWIGHFSHGQFYHKNITQSTPIKGEKIIGGITHYLIGITFSALLIFIWGIEWTKNPTIFPALIIGILTVAAPFFIMQPAFGFGIAASKTPNPKVARIKSLLTHSVYGVGLYLSALLLKTFFI